MQSTLIDLAEQIRRALHYQPIGGDLRLRMLSAASLDGSATRASFLLSVEGDETSDVIRITLEEVK